METRFKKMGGEYGGISKEQARFLFIQSIERTSPEVIEDLKDVFIHYGDLN